MKTFKLVIAGGGSTYTPGIVKSLLVQKDRFKLNELVLYDNNAKRQEDVGVIVRHVVEMFDPDVKLTLTTDPETAMTDADFIFAQMRVGLYAMREQDEKIPLRYGVVGHSRHTHHICRRHCFLNSLNLKTTFYKWIQYLR